MKYENAMVNFRSLDLLIDKINSMQDETRKLFPKFEKVHAFYSNPEIYTSYKYKEYQYDQDSSVDDTNSISNLDVKEDDFFPYSDCDHW